MIQRRTGWKWCGQMRPKSSSLASTQLAVFGGGGMLPMTPKTQSSLSSMEVETLFFGDVFLLRGHRTTAPHQRDGGLRPFLSFFNDFFRSLMTWRRSAKRSGIKCLLRCKANLAANYKKGLTSVIANKTFATKYYVLRRGQILISLIKMQINL